VHCLSQPIEWVLVALSWMQDIHLSTSSNEVDGWSSCHIGWTNCIKIIDCHQYCKVAMGAMACRTWSNTSWMDKNINFKLLTMRNLMIGQSDQNLGCMNLDVSGWHNYNRTWWMTIGSTTSMPSSCQHWTWSMRWSKEDVKLVGKSLSTLMTSMSS